MALGCCRSGALSAAAAAAAAAVPVSEIRRCC